MQYGIKFFIKKQDIYKVHTPTGGGDHLTPTVFPEALDPPNSQ